MTSREEIYRLLELEEEYYQYDIFDAHIRLEEAKDLLRVGISGDLLEEYDHILTELNFHIYLLTGLTDPNDLAIAREIIRDAHIENEYRNHTDGAYFSDGS